MFWQKIKWFGVLLLLVSSSSDKSNIMNLHEIGENFAQVVTRRNKIPTHIKIDDKKVKLNSTLQKKYQDFIKRLLKRYKSDYSFITIIDNDTAEVIAYYGYSRKLGKSLYDIGMLNSHPPASIFKIVSLASILEKNEIDLEEQIEFSGRSSTLYRYQLFRDNHNREYSLKRGFARSSNPVMGNAALKHIEPNDLVKTARDFGFNRQIFNLIRPPLALMRQPQSDYELAEMASGFNKESFVSPLHAAYISFLVANNGIAKRLSFIDKIHYSDRVIKIEDFGSESKKALFSKEMVKALRQAMVEVVKRGTASREFRRMNRGAKNRLLIGGKTGSITGGAPLGKRDWFVGFAKPKNSRSKGISFAVMNINLKKWYYKSPFLAKKVIEFYYKEFASKDSQVSLDTARNEGKTPI